MGVDDVMGTGAGQVVDRAVQPIARSTANRRRRRRVFAVDALILVLTGVVAQAVAGRAEQIDRDRGTV